MEPLHYNRQTNNKIYYFGIITIPEIFIMLVVAVVTLTIFKEPMLMLGAMLLYLAYLGFFRAGKPAGYDMHLFRSMWLPKVLRPCRMDPLYPIKIKKK